MAALIGFRSPRGPEAATAWRLRIRIVRHITSPWGLRFSSSSPLLLSSASLASPPFLCFSSPFFHRSSYRVRSRRQNVHQGSGHDALPCTPRFRMNFVCILPIAFLSSPEPFPARVSSKQPCRVLFLFPPFSSLSLCSTIERQIPHWWEGQSCPLVYHSIYQSYR